MATPSLLSGGLLTHSARLLTRRTELTVYPSWGKGGRAAAVITVGKMEGEKGRAEGEGEKGRADGEG